MASQCEMESSVEPLSLSTEKCAICLCSIDQMTKLDACSHIFCYSCIHMWSKNKRTCPLCNAEFSIFCTNFQKDGSFDEELAPIPSVPKPDLSGDLECLGHSYFLDEAVRLSAIAQNTQRAMVRSQLQNSRTKFGNKFENSWEQRKFESLTHVVQKLNVLTQLFRSDEHFDPLTVLQELYQVQAEMDLLGRGPNAKDMIPTASTRYTADDYDDLSSDEDDQDCYDFKGTHSKKDRKFHGRTANKPTSQWKKK